MLPVETGLVFFGAAVALALAPGPDNLFVLTQSALHGRRAGLLVTLGLCTGLLVHTGAVALGVAAFFQNSALAFTLVKALGAVYLAWLAVQAFRTASAAGSTGKDLAMAANPGASASSRPGAPRLYFRGILMNVTNPKVALFFLAFLPQFADPVRGSLPAQIALLGAVFFLATLLVFGGVAWLAGWLGERLEHSVRAQIILNRVAGTVFTLLALRLLFVAR